MDDNIRIERVPGYPPKIREDGEGNDDKKDEHPDRKKKRKSQVTDDHVDTVAWSARTDLKNR